MNIRQYLFSIIFSTVSIFMLQAQTEVWPVQVSGSMLPPYSLDLKVYSLERAEDLSFTAILKDPVEANLLVKPVITVEQNGTVIYQTDPNYAGKTILLSQFNPIILNGSALGEYLSNVALTGAQPGSKGSVEMPEGFNQVCLQLYGVERNVPVSNKFCISGNFRLCQPPQISKPTFNEKIKMPEVQNYIFSWQPMHIGSPNNPGPVEYTFELVELPVGVMNANDVFASALKVYTTTTMATSLIYTQGEPTLEPNKYYAWRVTATSVMYPTSKLFQNDGKGEVSIFILYEGEVPAGDVNPFDKASPRGCSVYETSYGAVSKADNVPVIASPNQNVKVGYFDMKITEAYSSQTQSYSGKGLVEYPMLRSVLEVEFKNIKVNKEGRVYEAESISALIDPALQFNLYNLSKESIEKAITSKYIDKLNTLLQKPKSDVAELAEGSTVFNSLPVSLHFEKQQPPVAVIGMVLTPTNAFINLLSQTDDGGIYVATLIPTTPFGVKNNAYLIPIHADGIERSSVKLLESIESGNVVSDKSKMRCNCKGFESLNDQVQLSISPDIMTRTDNGAPVTFEPTKETGNYDNKITEVENIPRFKLNNLPGFTFQAKSGKLDLSSSENGFNKDVNDYTAKQSINWKGLRLKDIQLTIPEKYNIVDPNSPLTLDNGEIYIDENKLAYGHFSKTNVLGLDKGKMGPWNYSIDTMKVTMDAHQIGKFRLSGNIKTPFFDDHFPYRAVVAETRQKQIQLDAIIPSSKLGMSIWHGSFTTQKPSSVDARLVQLGEERQLTPKCDFTGDLNVNFTDKEFRAAILNTNKGETLDALKNALKIDNFAFELSGLWLDGLSNDPMNEREKRFKIEGFDLKNVSLQIGGTSHKLSSASLKYVTEEKRERLGLKTIVVKGSSKVELTIWAAADKGTFRFEGIEVNNIDLKCNCGVASVIPSKDEWDRIIDDFYEKHYILSAAGFTQSGTQSVFPEKLFYIGKELAIEKIKMNTIAWFPTIDNNSAINIPFLDRNLSIENIGGAYTGKYRNGVAVNSKTEWTKEVFNSLANESTGDLHLPLIITEELWSKFGFKGDYTLPENYKLFITEFKTAGSDNLSNATVKIGLVGALMVEEKEVFVYFESNEDIAIGPDKISLKDILLHLTKDAKLDENVTYLSSGNGDKTAETGSYVGLDCTAGIHNFNLQGHYTMPSETLIGYDETGAVTGPAVFGFRLIENSIDGNGALLTEFKAPLKTTYKSAKGWQEWSFSTDGDRHIVFNGGKSLEAYLDYSSTTAVDRPQGEIDDLTRERLYNSYFRGIIFNQIGFSIPILEQNRVDAKSNPEFFKDTVSYSFYEIDSKAFFSKYQGFHKVKKENLARLGGWQYHLDTIRFNIEYNQLDADKLTLKGATLIPLFRSAPADNKAKWEETFTDAWVPYSLSIEYDAKEQIPAISGFVDGVNESLFELNYIHGMGMNLDKESFVDFGYDKDRKITTAKASLNGRAIYFIEKLDAKIPFLKFQNFNVNHNIIKKNNGSDMCSSNDIAGIESIDFGTWSIMYFTEVEKEALSKAANSSTGQNLSGKIKESKFAKGLGADISSFSKMVGFDISIHEPSFFCTGSEWKMVIGLDLSIMRDKSNLTASQQEVSDKFNPKEAAERKKAEEENSLKPLEKDYKEAQNNIKTIADERSKLLAEKQRLETELKTIKKDKNIKINGNNVSYNSASNKSEIDSRNSTIASLNTKITAANTKYKTALTSVKEKYKPFKEQSAKLKTASNELDKQTKAVVERTEKYKNAGAGERLEMDKEKFKKDLAEAKATKTGAFSASGDIEVSFDGKGYKDVALTCLGLGGEFGPVKFKGGINLFRDETTKGNYDPNAVQSAWGNGFLGMIDVSILDYNFATKFQTGVKLDGATAQAAQDFRYWFADLSFSANPGLPLGQSTFSLTGIGGGFYYNMAKEIPGLDQIKKQSPPPVANNDLCKAEGMEAGKSLSGLKYTVSRGSMGGYLSAEISHPARVSLEGILSLEIAIINDEFKFKNFGLGLNGYALYEDFATRKTESPLIVKGDINLNFEENIKVIGGIDFRFGKKAGPLEIAAPSDKNSNSNSWNSIRFCFSNEFNYVHAGSWGIPGRLGSGPSSGLNFLSAGFEAPLFGKVSAGLYAQLGNKTDGQPKISYLLPNYKGTDNSLESSSILSDRFAANAGFRLSADMGSEFLIFKWYATAEIGANLAIQNWGKGVTCNGKKEKVGFENGYYLTGNAYASLKATASIDTWVKEFEIFDGSVDLVLDFGFPNPSYLLGDFAVKYNVLGGSYAGTQNMEIDLGEKPCDDYQADPLVGIKAHHDFEFFENKENGDNVFVHVKVKNNVVLEKNFNVRKKGNDGKTLKCSLDVTLKEKSSGKIIPLVDRLYMKDKLYDVCMLPYSLMKPNKSYIIEAKYTWTSAPFTMQNGVYQATGYAAKIAEEVVTKEFKTSPLWGIKVHDGIFFNDDPVDLEGGDILYQKLDSLTVLHQFDFSKEQLLETEDNSKEYLGCDIDVSLINKYSGDEIARLDKINEKVYNGDISKSVSIFKLNQQLKAGGMRYTAKVTYHFRTYNKTATGEEINIKKMDDQIFTRTFEPSPYYEIKAHNDFVFPENGGFINKINTFKIRHNMAPYQGHLGLSNLIIRNKATGKVVRIVQNFISNNLNNDILYFEPDFLLQPNTVYSMEARYIERAGNPLIDHSKETVFGEFATSPAYNIDIHNSLVLGSQNDRFEGGFKNLSSYKEDKGIITVWLQQDSLKIASNINMDEVFKIKLANKVKYIKCDLEVKLEDSISGKTISLLKGSSTKSYLGFMKNYYLTQKLEANKAYLIKAKYTLYSYETTEAGQMFNKQSIKEELANATFITSQFYGSPAFKGLEVNLNKTGKYGPDFAVLKVSHPIDRNIELGDGSSMEITPKLTVINKLTNETISFVSPYSSDTENYPLEFSNLNLNTTYILKGNFLWNYVDKKGGHMHPIVEPVYVEFVPKDLDKTTNDVALKTKFDDADIIGNGGIDDPINNNLVTTNFNQIKIKHKTDIEKERLVLSENNTPKFMKCDLIVSIKEKLSGVAVPVNKIRYEDGTGYNNGLFFSIYKISQELKLNTTYLLEVKYNWMQYDKSETGVVSNEKIVRVESESSEFTTVDKPKETIHNEFIFPKEGETISSKSTEIKFRHNAAMNKEIRLDEFNSVRYSLSSIEINQRGTANRIKLGKPTTGENGLVTVCPINAPGLKPNTTYNLLVKYDKLLFSRDSGGISSIPGKPEIHNIIFKTGDE